MGTKTVSFRSPQEKIASLDIIAELQQRDRSFLINEAVDQYISIYEYQRELIEKGLRQCEVGDMVDHDEVFRMVRAGSNMKKTA